MSLSAQVVNGGQQLVLTSDDYGSQAAFTVASTNSAAGTTGLARDLRRGRRGRHHQRRGRHRAGPVPDGPDRRIPPWRDCRCRSRRPNISSLTDLGSLSYQPGHRPVAHLAGRRPCPIPTQGEITQTVQNIQNQSTGLNSQIAFYANIVSQEQKMLLEPVRHAWRRPSGRSRTRAPP